MRTRSKREGVCLYTTAVLAVGCLGAASVAGADALQEQAAAIFGKLPESAENPDNPITDAKVRLGQTLYFDPRLSKNQDISCNSCHRLDRFGVDNEPTSPGHKGQRGGRNSPTVLNAALHIAQFWDGREPDVEAQAKGPVLNPIEMALPDAAAVETVLRSIPGYEPLFKAAFPGQAQPISFDNMALAIGAFERRLLTPSPFDAYVEGSSGALTEHQKKGLETFIQTGCITCHSGPAVGGGTYRKLGLVNPYETKDPGRFNVTSQEGDRGVFKVPSLRNIAKTGPYFHDGSLVKLADVVRLMGWHQLGVRLDAAQVADIVMFLDALTGKVDRKLASPPELPESGPSTPKPDPT